MGWNSRRSQQCVLVVGGGRAGVAAAEELRRQGFDGDVVVLHDESTPPYDRTACAKGLLTGHKRPVDALLKVQGAESVTWRLGRRAIALDSHERVVHTDTGERFGYDGLVIASGAGPVPPRGWPMHEPGLHVLYHLGDAWRLRTHLRDARRVAVVGAGLTGCEVAHAVRTLARECVLIDPRPHALARPLGDMVGRLVTREIARDGVELRLGRRVTGLARGRRGWLLLLDDGSEVQADVVVTTTGERPDTGWLEGTPGVDVSDGVLCDASLRVVGLPDAVAAGTVARWPNLRYGSSPRRVGQWITALEQGAAAARSLLLGEHSAPPFVHVPRFWSDQFGLRIQVCGVLPAEAEVTLTERRPGSRRQLKSGVTVEYRVDGELAGLVSVNDPRAFTALTRTMLAASGPRVEAPQAPAFTDALTPPGFDLPVAVGGGGPTPRVGARAAAVASRAGVPGPARAPSISGPIRISGRPRLYAVR
jgi:NADPH-dependent 2,4-dienoyl-CoA reductase/sulfur reductase-like enzyme